MTLFEHLAELRSRLMKVIVAVMVGAIVGWFLYPQFLEIILVPYENLNKNNELLLTTDILEPFTTRLKVSGYLGIALAMPIILWQVWRFVTPALYPQEKRYAVPFVASSLLLFFLGASIAYYTLEPALNFLISVAGAPVDVRSSPGKYVNFVTYMMLAFGIGMEFPVLLVALQLIGVLRPRQLLGWWRQVTVVIVVIAAVITPSGDPISMLALAVPMYVLYFVAIGVGVLVLRLRRRGEAKAARAGNPPPAA